MPANGAIDPPPPPPPQEAIVTAAMRTDEPTRIERNAAIDNSPSGVALAPELTVYAGCAGKGSGRGDADQKATDTPATSAAGRPL
jgi:hypothetical protein